MPSSCLPFPPSGLCVYLHWLWVKYDPMFRYVCYVNHSISLQMLNKTDIYIYKYHSFSWCPTLSNLTDIMTYLICLLCSDIFSASTGCAMLINGGEDGDITWPLVDFKLTSLHPTSLIHGFFHIARLCDGVLVEKVATATQEIGPPWAIGAGLAASGWPSQDASYSAAGGWSSRDFYAHDVKECFISL